LLGEQAVPQLSLTQVGTVCGPPAGHSEGPQQPEALMHAVLPAHSFSPDEHVPLQGASCAMHMPLQSCVALSGQEGTHAVPLQRTVPPTGFWHALVHSVRPQVARALLLTHTPLQLCQPGLQRTEQLPPLQIAVPFGSAAHFLQSAPQAVASSSAGQLLPHWWCPVPQVNVQAPLAEHPTFDEPWGTGQGSQEAPQASTDVRSTH
jgi:hypothetical protein